MSVRVTEGGTVYRGRGFMLLAMTINRLWRAGLMLGAALLLMLLVPACAPWPGIPAARQTHTYNNIGATLPVQGQPGNRLAVTWQAQRGPVRTAEE